MGQDWNSETDKQVDNKTTISKWIVAAIPRSKVLSKIPALASIMHQNTSFSQVILLPTPLIKSDYSFYNRAADSDKTPVRILEFFKFFWYILITACSQITVVS